MTGAEWAKVAHRLARAAGVEIPGEGPGCRWIAVQAQPGRLHLIANLIHLNGAWHTPPAHVLRGLSDEARRIEQDLRLIPVHSRPAARPAISAPPPAASPFASVLAQFADEQTGPLAVVRGLIEHTAHRIAHQPGVAGTDTVHRLGLIARRLHAIQQDLDTTAARLAQPRAAPAPPCGRHSNHRSR